MKPQKSLKPPKKLSSQQIDVSAFRGTELIFYGHMGLTNQADTILSEFGYGRAHFRALYVIARNPGISSNSLVTKLKITNQSMSRVMAQILLDGLVAQKADSIDRRQRLHFLLPRGIKLEERVRLAQFDALNAAYRTAGPNAVEGFLRVLYELLPPEDRGLLTYPMETAVATKSAS